MRLVNLHIFSYILLYVLIFLSNSCELISFLQGKKSSSEAPGIFQCLQAFMLAAPLWRKKTGEKPPWKQGSGPKETRTHLRAETTAFVSKEAENRQKKRPRTWRAAGAGPNNRGHTGHTLWARHPTNIIPLNFSAISERRCFFHFKDKLQAVKWLN